MKVSLRAHFPGDFLLVALRSSTRDLISSAGDLSRGGGGGELLPLLPLLSGLEVRARLGGGRFLGADQLADRARTVAAAGEFFPLPPLPPCTPSLPPCTPSLLLCPPPLTPWLLSIPSTESDETTPRALPCGRAEEAEGEELVPTASEDLCLEIMRPKLMPRDKRFFGWLGEAAGLLLLAFSLAF